jgi:hypothetical protein
MIYKKDSSSVAGSAVTGRQIDNRGGLSGAIWLSRAEDWLPAGPYASIISVPSPNMTTDSFKAEGKSIVPDNPLNY